MYSVSAANPQYYRYYPQAQAGGMYPQQQREREELARQYQQQQLLYQAYQGGVYPNPGDIYYQHQQQLLLQRQQQQHYRRQQQYYLQQQQHKQQQQQQQQQQQTTEEKDAEAEDGEKERGTEELLGEPITNGSGDLSVDNDAKKAKLDRNNTEPSKVIHLRNIPQEASDAEVIQLGLPFGKVTNCLMLKGKNQAFIEMGELQNAVAMVKYFANCPPTLRERQVYIQYSNHKELKTDRQNMMMAMAGGVGGAGAASAVAGAGGLLGTSSPGLQGVAGGMDGSAAGAGQANSVLRVVIEHMIYPVTIDILYQIFSRFGRVLKIITFVSKANQQFQALIQMASAGEAAQCKMSLDGQNIYNSCCTLRIEFSRMTSLNVRFNNDKSRDFTNPSLPTGNDNMDPAMMGMPGLGLPPGMGPGGGLAHGMAGMPAGLMGAMAGMSPGMGVGNAVVLVSNLNEEMITPDHLFTLFGVYGDVIRVKILFNKKDNALIQYADGNQAQLAIQHMNNVKVFGKPIRVAASKHSVVQLPKEGQPDAGLTKDFQQSPLHRFKKPGSKNFQNIYPPSAVLHLSNIPAHVTEDELKVLFSTYGTVVGFKFFAKDRKMALIQLEDTEQAITALMALHNHQLGEQSHLRVSFSRAIIERTDPIE